MAKFKVCVHMSRRRTDGLWQVYIRVTHNRKVGYIKTDKVVNAKGLYKDTVVDPFVLQSCNAKIIRYAEELNRHDIETWTVQQVEAAVFFRCYFWS